MTVTKIFVWNRIRKGINYRSGAFLLRWLSSKNHYVKCWPSGKIIVLLSSQCMFSVKLCAVLNYTQVFRHNAALQHHYICSPSPTSKALSTPICSQNDRFQLILHLRLNITVAAVYPFTLKRSKDSLIPFSVMRMTSNVFRIGSVFTLMRRGSTMSTVSIQDCVFKYMRLR